MSTPKVIRAAQSLLRQVNLVAHKLTKGLVSWLLRGLLRVGRQPQAGFVLPTTVLLLLVVVLTVGAISYRTFTRTQQAITERQQQVVYNAATPVIDRAKSKIEFLFDPEKDTRGGGIPSQTQLLGMMLNDGRNLGGVSVPPFPDANTDPYTFVGETRVDINGDGALDNAWRYRVDLDGDGNVNSPDNKDGWAIYSIIFTAPTNSDNLRDSSPTSGWLTRARALQIRNAPLSNASESNLKCQRNEAAGGVPLINGDGWFPDQRNTTKIRKNFQVNAYVVPDNPSGTVATLEFQQDREATQGFKWAAWFRNDLEIFPGPAFNWNGAMHTEANLIVGGSNSFRGFLVSSPDSCIRSKDASEITLKEVDSTTLPPFRGRVITGTIRDNDYTGAPRYDLPIDERNRQTRVMNADLDSVNPGSLRPIDFSVDPVILQTEGHAVPRNNQVRPETFVAGNWATSDFAKPGARFRTIKEDTTPYVDDTFRADNRWGPKPTWGRDALPIGVTSKANAGSGSTAKIGDPITGVAALTGNDPQPGEDSASVGLDGYWERRARVDGLRLIVGQRLELGDPAGWGGPGGQGSSDAFISRELENEPLRPWTEGCTAGDRCNEQRQRKALWDNLAAVQATAVYHNATDTTAAERDFPDACLVTTVHPGTPTTLDRSATFENLAFGLPASAIPGYTNQPNPVVISDFFRGRGTNGWEYSTPRQADFRNSNSELMKALKNLAYFAGDPNGGAPSFTPEQARGANAAVHPYPSMAMWGDFSMLRRVFDLLDGGTSYDNLSPADKTTLHTAACTLGMLAYNVDYLEKLKVYDDNPLNDPTRVDDAASTPSGRNGMRSIAGFTNAELLPTGSTATELTVNTALLADPRFSQGLRGRIRVIDLIVKGAITAANLNSIPNTAAAPLRPPASFVNGLQANAGRFNTEGGMELLAWDKDKSNNPETYVRLLERWRDALGTAGTDAAQRLQLNREISLAQLIITREQVARDRTWGFRGTYGSLDDEQYTSFSPLGDCGFDNSPVLVPGWTTVKADGSPTAFTLRWVTGGTTNTLAVNDDPFARFCSTRPRYPILYSLFSAKPAEPFNLANYQDLATAYASGFVSHRDITDNTERNRVRDREDSRVGAGAAGQYIRAENASAVYRVIQPADIALRPLTLSQGGVALGGVRPGGGGGAWRLPTAAGSPGVGSTPNSNQFNLIKICGNPNATTGKRCSEPIAANSATFQRPESGTLVRVALKDSAFYNGREMMPVRALNLDLRLMADSNYEGDLWLPKKGIVYAYREDALSEMHIVRPNTGNDWEACNSDAEIQTNACLMRTDTVSAYRSTDPPLNAQNSISPKPVDYYADPDRRPYGFRLMQGANLRRNGDEGRGLSFISDNPVYVQGDFNRHERGGAELQEFTELLAADYGNFYDRRNLNLSFANRDEDQWRPSEVVADAVTLLSSNFCDGSIEDGFANLRTAGLPTWLRERYGCQGNGTGGNQRTSFHNQNRPNALLTGLDALTQRFVLWERTNLIDSFPLALGTTQRDGRNIDEGESPIYISRNGQPVHWNDVSGNNRIYDGSYVETRLGGNNPSDGKALIGAADNTRMNLIMVSGIVPSRQGQSYGGLHNFPRFLESWENRNLFISGAFLQLGFSNGGTGPFDQEAWQPGAPAPRSGSGDNEWIRYYHPPNRRWGYDVGLQYAPPGAVAQRFQFAEDIRSEFYTEPPANDPYIRNLCNSLKTVRPGTNCPT